MTVSAQEDPATLSPETIRELVLVHVGLEVTDEQLQRLMPRVAHQISVSRALDELDLGDVDPRHFEYLHDRRLPR